MLTSLPQIQTACDEYFDEFTAVAICNELGYTNSTLWWSGTNSWSTQYMGLNNVACSDVEQSFSNCFLSKLFRNIIRLVDWKISIEYCEERVFMSCDGKYLMINSLP